MKIYIWGTGVVSEEITTIVNMNDVEAFVDNNDKKEFFKGKRVIKPEMIVDCEYDCIIIAIADTESIYKQCKELALDLKKIIFTRYNHIISDLNKNQKLVQDVLGENYCERLLIKENDEFIIPKSHTFSNTNRLKDKFGNDLYFRNDYVRIKTLEMIANEINENKVGGQTAEVGVFKGSFAKYINFLFNNKKLYLFDTFESFSKKESLDEIRSGNCDTAFIEIFKNTSVSEVLNKMCYPDNIIIKQGLFPDSLNGLEEKFAFVSLDVDFEESMLECLRYFYPRMVEGGYIFVHDYNYCDSLNLRGIRNAIKRYEEEIGVSLHKVPICDQGGTVVISK